MMPNSDSLGGAARNLRCKLSTSSSTGMLRRPHLCPRCVGAIFTQTSLLPDARTPSRRLASSESLHKYTAIRKSANCFTNIHFMECRQWAQQQEKAKCKHVTQTSGKWVTEWIKCWKRSSEWGWNTKDLQGLWVESNGGSGNVCTFLWRKSVWSDLWWTLRWTPEGFLRHRSEQIPAGRWATRLNKDSFTCWTGTIVCTKATFIERGKNRDIHLPKGFQGDNVVRRWVSFHKACFCQSQNTLYRLLRKHTQNCSVI